MGKSTDNPLTHTMGKSTDNPFTLLEQYAFNAWLIGRFPESEIYLTNIGINKDIPIKLKGLKCCEIKEFQNLIFRAYQKGKKTRYEHHWNGSAPLKHVLQIELEFQKNLLETQNKQKPIPKIKA